MTHIHEADKKYFVIPKMNALEFKQLAKNLEISNQKSGKNGIFDEAKQFSLILSKEISAYDKYKKTHKNRTEKAIIVIVENIIPACDNYLQLISIINEYQSVVENATIKVHTIISNLLEAIPPEYAHKKKAFAKEKIGLAKVYIRCIDVALTYFPNYSNLLACKKYLNLAIDWLNGIDKDGKILQNYFYEFAVKEYFNTKKETLDDEFTQSFLDKETETKRDLAMQEMDARRQNLLNEILNFTQK